MHLKKNEGNAPPAETLCHQCGASSECEKAEAPGTCGASAAGSGLFLPHGERAGHPGGRAAVRGAEFRSPGAPDTPETQESMMECVCEHSLRPVRSVGVSVQTQVQACASVRAGCRPPEEDRRACPRLSQSPPGSDGPLSLHARSMLRGPGAPSGSRTGAAVVCLHPARGDSGRPCPPSTPSRTTGGTLLAITSGSRSLARAEGGWSSQA